MASVSIRVFPWRAQDCTTCAVEGTRPHNTELVISPSESSAVQRLAGCVVDPIPYPGNDLQPPLDLRHVRCSITSDR